MKKVTDNDLVLLYYGEHEEPDLASRVADSAELSARFAALCAQLDLADTYEPPERDEDFGAVIWQRIESHLAAPETRPRGLMAWLAPLAQPRFSLAGIVGIALVAVIAFMLGRDGGPGQDAAPLAIAALSPSALQGLDASRLLTGSVSSHLEQVDQVLTQFAHADQSSALEAEWATDMLVANRLYRQAAATQGNRRLADFLGVLEPLLIELAYEAQTASSATRERMQKEVRDGLLFRVRVVSQQLRKDTVTT